MEEKHDFILRVLKIFQEYPEDLIWGIDEQNNVKFYINCNDLFYWGTADAEEITINNINLLEKIKTKYENEYSFVWKDLFCCRSRKMRPQKSVYTIIPKALHHLFDACGSGM